MVDAIEIAGSTIGDSLIELFSRNGDDDARAKRRLDAFLAVFFDVEVAELSEVVVSGKSVSDDRRG